MAHSSHLWRFFRLGGFDQVRLETAEDLKHLDQLDQQLWSALSCPVQGLEFSPRTLSMLDTDGDGRVRVPEVLAAVRWATAMLRNMDGLMAGEPRLALADIDDAHPQGLALLASARLILKYLNKPADATHISIEDVAGVEELLLASALNGDGVVTPASTNDARLRQVIEDVMACVGSVVDRSGQPGVSSEQVEAFFDEAARYAAWHEETNKRPAELLPFGDATEDAARAFHALQPKIDDFFIRCDLAAFDPEAGRALNPSQSAYEALAAQNLTTAENLAGFPLARIAETPLLPLRKGVNPAWMPQLAALTRLVFEPRFQAGDSLTPAQWDATKALFAPHEAWKAAKEGACVESLGVGRVWDILNSPARADLEALIAKDLDLREQVASFDDVARLTYFTRDLLELLNNFVTFYDFYAQKRQAVFQAGTLYLDGRACELCVRVQDPATHHALASRSRSYLAYCQCLRRNSEERMTIAAVLTNGDADNLMVGRNGVFYDRNGNDWDATIIRIVDHPISVRQAFWSPYKRLARMVGDQIEKFASAKDKAVATSANKGIAGASAPALAAGKPAAAFDVGKFAGIFAAIGLALGAMGTAITAILGGFLALPVWQMPLAVGGLLLLVSGPSMLIAYLKLRQRTLGPILDACGWAVNSKASINIPFGATLTRLAALPPGAERTLRDPFAEKKTPWKRWAILVALLAALGFAWNKGYLQTLGRNITAAVSTSLKQPAASVGQPPAAAKSPTKDAAR